MTKKVNFRWNYFMHLTPPLYKCCMLCKRSISFSLVHKEKTKKKSLLRHHSIIYNSPEIGMNSPLPNPGSLMDIKVGKKTSWDITFNYFCLSCLRLNWFLIMKSDAEIFLPEKEGKKLVMHFSKYYFFGGKLSKRFGFKCCGSDLWWEVAGGLSHVKWHHIHHLQLRVWMWAH